MRSARILLVADQLIERLEEHAEDGDAEMFSDLGHALAGVMDAAVAAQANEYDEADRGLRTGRVP